MTRTVWVVFNDRRKDFSKAEEYGQLKDVFSSLGRTYNPTALVSHARYVADQFQEGDYLLVVGDPALVGICMSALFERWETVTLLRWDRDNMKYEPLEVTFDWQE